MSWAESDRKSEGVNRPTTLSRGLSRSTLSDSSGLLTGVLLPVVTYRLASLTDSPAGPRFPRPSRCPWRS